MNIEIVNQGEWWYLCQPAIHVPVHILPYHDDKQHYITEECSCCPSINEDGNVVHNSFDGRELFETGRRKYS